MSRAISAAATQTLSQENLRLLETVAHGIQTQWQLERSLDWDVFTTDERLAQLEQQEIIFTLWIRRQRYIALTAAGVTLLRQEGMLP